MANYPTETVSTDKVDQSTDLVSEGLPQIKAAIDKVNEMILAYNTAGGVAGLDGDSKIPNLLLPNATRGLTLGNSGYGHSVDSNVNNAGGNNKFIKSLSVDAHGHVIAAAEALQTDIINIGSLQETVARPLLTYVISYVNGIDTGDDHQSPGSPFADSNVKGSMGLQFVDGSVPEGSIVVGVELIQSSQFEVNHVRGNIMGVRTQTTSLPNAEFTEFIDLGSTATHPGLERGNTVVPNLIAGLGTDVTQTLQEALANGRYILYNGASSGYNPYALDAAGNVDTSYTITMAAVYVKYQYRTITAT